MITCPSCGGEKFESHSVGDLELVSNIYLMLHNAAKYFTCVECEYVIAQPSDLNLMTVTVYVLGNSLSKQRQGLKRMIDEGLIYPSPSQRKINEQSIKQFGCFKTPGDWVFTKAAWEKYQANPEFPLAEGQHKTEVKVLY